MLDDVLEALVSGTFDAALNRNEDRGAVRWLLLFVGTVFAIGGLGLAAAGRPALGLVVLFAGTVLFGIGI